MDLCHHDCYEFWWIWMPLNQNTCQDLEEEKVYRHLSMMKLPSMWHTDRVQSNLKDVIVVNFWKQCKKAKKRAVLQKLPLLAVFCSVLFPSGHVKKTSNSERPQNCAFCAHDRCTVANTGTRKKLQTFSNNSLTLFVIW